MLKERESVKAKGVKDWQQDEHLRNLYIEIVRQLQHSGARKQPTTINEGSLQSNWARLPNNLTMTQPIKNNRISETNHQLVILEQVFTNKILEFF
jgi:hypothetical protein